MAFNTEPGDAGGGSRPPGGTVGAGSDRSSSGEYNTSDPVGSFVGTVQRVLLQPVGFFRSIPLQGNLINPIVFAVICAFIGAFLGGIITILGAIFGLGAQTVGESIIGFIVALILTPILTPIAILIGAAISHLFVMLFVRPRNAGYWATFRVVSYVSATSLISWVPIIGGLVAFVWGVVLSIFGMREMHSTTTGRAALVVLVPVAIIVLLVALLFSALLVAIFFGTRPG